mmetsp:Transcript_58967/g.133508  ORF Transcript_58967/g.133508 Transcript_58967/m.133508 type:complete len:258 (+) Transcript_58967:303-1076(+)
MISTCFGHFFFVSGVSSSFSSAEARARLDLHSATGSCTFSLLFTLSLGLPTLWRIAYGAATCSPQSRFPASSRPPSACLIRLIGWVRTIGPSVSEAAPKKPPRDRSRRRRGRRATRALCRERGPGPTSSRGRSRFGGPGSPFQGNLATSKVKKAPARRRPKAKPQPMPLRMPRVTKPHLPKPRRKPGRSRGGHFQKKQENQRRDHPLPNDVARLLNARAAIRERHKGGRYAGLVVILGPPTRNGGPCIKFPWLPGAF